MRLRLTQPRDEAAGAIVVNIEASAARFIEAMGKAADQLTAMVDAFARNERRRDAFAYLREVRKREQALTTTHIAASFASAYADLGLVPPPGSIVRGAGT